MKSVFLKRMRRPDLGLISFLLCFVLIPFVGKATMSSASFNGNVGNPPPQVDATNFINTGTWNISTTPLPYQTANTLNYTNTGAGTMNGSVGWEFDFGPTSSGRTWSTSFFNDNNATISALDGSFTILHTSTTVSYLLVSATNIVNKGLLEAGPFGEIILNGSEVNLSRSFFEITPVAGLGSPFSITNFTPDTGIYDEVWSGGSSNKLTVSGSPWNGTNIDTFTAQNANEPCGKTDFQIGPFTPQTADSYATNIGPSQLMTTNSTGQPNSPITVYSNIIHQAIFVFVSDSNIVATTHFGQMLSATNPFLPMAVRLASVSTNIVNETLQTNTLYVVDTLAAAGTNNGLVTNAIVFPSAACTSPTARPASAIISRIDNSGIFASGFPGMGPPSSIFFYDPSTFSNSVVTGIADVYSVLVDNLATEPPSGFSITNAPGRIHIYAKDLDLSKTRISAASEILIQATNLIGSTGAVMDCQNLSYNLGSTNGLLNITNLVDQNVQRFQGTVSEWSGVWTNVMTNIFSNFITNSTAGGFMSSPVTNTTEVDIAITVVDASGLSTTVPVTVLDLALHSTNMIVSDSVTVTNSLLFDGQSLTIQGEIFLGGGLQNWVAANAPTLLNFTNNGFLDIPNSAHFGDDRATDYAAFVNHEFILSAGQTIDSDYLEINGGFNVAEAADFTATCKTGLVMNADIFAAGDIQFSANSLTIDPSFLSAEGSLDFTVTNLLTDGGITGNAFDCQNGFNLYVKPTLGDLSGTTITDTALGQDLVVHVWAGQDRGMTEAGFSNNVTIGTLVLNPQAYVTNHSWQPLFEFSGVSAGVTNGMYIDKLDLSQLSTDYANMIQIDPNLNIYFRTVILGFTPPGGLTPEQYLDGQFGGLLHHMPNAVVSQSGAVDWNATDQRIDGFGASSAFSGGTWTSAQADMFFSTNTGIGLSLLRNQIQPPTTTNAVAFASASEIGLMQMAQTRGATVWSTPWSPPTFCKNTNTLNGGSYMGIGNGYTNLLYASELAGYVANMKNTYHVSIYAISIQNEPDVSTTYPSCLWSAQQYHDFATNLYNALVASNVVSTKIMLPEDEHWQTTYYTTAMNDANVAADVGIIGNHNYDGPNFDTGQTTPPAALPNYGKSLWETEVSTGDAFDGGIINAIYWATRIHLFMTVAQANAWHYWWLITDNPDNEGLTDNLGNPAKRMYALGQYSRFVRPGYYRIDISGGGGLLTSAYKDTNSANYVIVAINTNVDTDIVQTFNLTNFTGTSVTPWITSGTLSLSNQPAVTVSNSSFTYYIPALSVVTFVGQASSLQGQVHVVPALTPIANQTINPGVTLVITNVATDASSPPPVLTFSLLNGPSNAVFNASSGIFTWRPLVNQANTVNPITVKVADNASPSFSATNGFTVTVNPVIKPVVNLTLNPGGNANLLVTGQQGPDYTLQTSTNMVDWQNVMTSNSPVTPLTLVITKTNEPARFYRVQIGP